MERLRPLSYFPFCNFFIKRMHKGHGSIAIFVETTAKKFDFPWFRHPRKSMKKLIEHKRK